MQDNNTIYKLELTDKEYEYLENIKNELYNRLSKMSEDELKDYLGIEVEERKVHKNELKDFVEVGLCGTAAVISPIGQITNHEEVINVPSGMQEIGPVLGKLRSQCLVHFRFARRRGLHRLFHDSGYFPVQSLHLLLLGGKFLLIAFFRLVETVHQLL